jgi:hypothetical protein
MRDSAPSPPDPERGVDALAAREEADQFNMQSTSAFRSTVCGANSIDCRPEASPAEY